MQCDDVIRLLPDMLYNEIDEHAREKVNEHLVSCPACWNEYESFKKTVRVLDQWPPTEAPADTAELARLLEGTASGPKRRRAWIINHPILSGLAAGLILFAGLLALKVNVTTRDGSLILSLGHRPVNVTTGVTTELPPDPRLYQHINSRVDLSTSLAGQALVEYLHDWTSAYEQRQIELLTLMDQLRQQDMTAVEQRLASLEQNTSQTRRGGSPRLPSFMQQTLSDAQRLGSGWKPGQVVIDNQVYQAVLNEQTGQYELHELTYPEDSEVYQ